MLGPMQEMQLKLSMLGRCAQWVMSVAGCAVFVLWAMGLSTVAQETSTLLVLRPQPKGIASDRIRTVTPGQGANVVPSIISSQVSEIRIGGKPATITAWTPLLNGPTHLQLVVLFDSQLRIGLGKQFDEIKALFNSMPSNVEIAVGVMLQGKAVIKQPFTTDRTLAGNALHLPTMEDSMNPTNVSRGLDLSARPGDPLARSRPQKGPRRTVVYRGRRRRAFHRPGTRRHSALCGVLYQSGSGEGWGNLHP